MSSKNSLERIIYGEFLKSSLVPILVIEIALLFLFFSVNRTIADRNQQALLEEVSHSLAEISGRQARIIDQKLNEISRLSVMMQQDHEYFFQQQFEHCQVPETSEELVVHPNGALYLKHDNGGAGLYFSAGPQLNDQNRLALAHCSRAMDPLLKSIVDTNPLVAQAYFNTPDGMNRLYPFIPDAASHYGAAINMPEYNFYYLADEQHNPEKHPVWTSAYLDPAGQGWLISNIVPIYNKDVLEGVSGLDVTIDELVNSILDQRLPWKSSAFMVNDNGMILAMAPQIEKLLGLMELKQHTYNRSITRTVEKPEAFNIFNGSDAGIRQQLVTILKSEHGVHELKTSETTYLAVRHTISETGWQVVTLVDETALFEPIERLRGEIDQLGYVAIGLMLLFYMLFFFWLQRKATRLGTRLAQPVEALADATAQLGETLKPVEIPPSGITEIDTVYERFNDMASELHDKTERLVEAESQQRAQQVTAAMLEQMATTDPLTGLNNRRKIEEALGSEIARAGRSHKTFSVIILDVDGFKEVNDTHGHPVGDQVLVEIGKVLVDSVRQADVVGRWGGEEFILICPVTALQGAANVAENLRQRIQESRLEVVGCLTASFGVTSYQAGDAIEDLVARADRAMYQAKREGRNQVQVYNSSMAW